MWDPKSAAAYMKKLSGKITDRESFFCNAEEVHRDMDDFLCSLLRQLGYHEVVEIFKSTGKWYS